MRMLLPVLAIGLAMIWVDPIFAGEVHSEEEKRELLAEYDTISRYEGISFVRCQGLTLFCPHQCDGSGEVATFTIVQSIQQGGKQSRRQKGFGIRVSDFYRKPIGSPEILKTVRSLNQGDLVRLSWRREYVTTDRSGSSKTSILKLEKVESKSDAGDGLGIGQGFKDAFESQTFYRHSLSMKILPLILIFIGFLGAPVVAHYLRLPSKNTPTGVGTQPVAVVALLIQLALISSGVGILIARQFG